MAIKSPILPPWWRYPKIEQMSIGWRMGAGEAYMDKFIAFFDSLSLDEKLEYCGLFVEPPLWDGFYKELLHKDDITDGDDEFYIENGSLNSTSSRPFVKVWEKDGKPLFSNDYIKQHLSVKEPTDFVFFWSHKEKSPNQVDKSCLSQWYSAEFYYQADKYCCMEQYMMAQKAELFKDFAIKEKILNAQDPGEIKALGREVANFNEVIWGLFKYAIVLNGNFLKFSQNIELGKFLLATEDKVLVEASPQDKIWGIGLDANHQDACNIDKWQGENLLGRALMEVRNKLKESVANLSMCENYQDFGKDE